MCFIAICAHQLFSCISVPPPVHLCFARVCFVVDLSGRICGWWHFHSARGAEEHRAWWAQLKTGVPSAQKMAAMLPWPQPRGFREWKGSAIHSRKKNQHPVNAVRSSEQAKNKAWKILVFLGTPRAHDRLPGQQGNGSSVRVGTPALVFVPQIHSLQPCPPVWLYVEMGPQRK